MKIWRRGLGSVPLILCLWMAGVSARGQISGTYPTVHYSRFDQLHDKKSWDQINGQRIEESGSIGFLLSVGSNMHVPGNNIPSELVDLLAQGYVLEAPDEFNVEIVEIEAGEAAIDLNTGIGVKATLAIQIPDGVSPDTRRITLKFPNAILIRELVHAETPTSVPTITFSVTNFTSEDSRASRRWWQRLIFGSLFLFGGILALLGCLQEFGNGSNYSSASEDYFGCIILLLGITLPILAISFLGAAVEDLSVIHEHAIVIVASLLAIPSIIFLSLHSEKWQLGSWVAAILFAVTLVCWWVGWTQGKLGVLVLLPGVSLGTIVGGLRHAFRPKKDLEAWP